MILKTVYIAKENFSAINKNKFRHKFTHVHICYLTVLDIYKNSTFTIPFLYIKNNFYKIYLKINTNKFDFRDVLKLTY